LKPSELYLNLIDEGQLSFDEEQAKLLEKFNHLNESLTKRSKSWFGQKKIKGLYIRGEVGRGKTQMMDIFFETLNIQEKKRVHFHRFMKILHDDLDKISAQKDPLKKVAKDISKKTKVLCFDEFYVEDIGDAMLLGRFINELFENKVTLITTSNTHPDNLYRDGLHRSRFLPAIKSIKENCEIYELNSAQDYRLRTLEQLEIFIIGKGNQGIKELESNFTELTNGEFQDGQKIKILGREINTIKLAQGSLWVSFKEICEGPRSAKDYIEICSEFHTLFVSNVPIMKGSNDDSARRFIALVDECYERNVNLILSMETELQQIYSGERLLEPFKRTISRLEEMRSKEYLSRPHLI
tara:strand:- start:482 stop:1540 length:1059 start_codon:yes stop_codon:yes gene_type:complete